jgi:hypothetical protein
MERMLRRIVVGVIGLVLILSTFGSTGWAQSPTPKGVSPTDKTKEQLREQPKLPVKECRDPAAQSLTFRIISKDSLHPTQGRIRITGVVKNIGNVAFESDPRQASAQLLEESPGARAVVKTQQNIARLEPNATITLNYETSWDTAREFPPKYVLLLSYDPDIYNDANKKNDDCNPDNNRKELSGEQINRGWR